MARSRNIKPGFFTNEDLVELDFATRLLFAGLWTVADKAGRLQDRPKKIKIDVFPADNVDVDAMLQSLHDSKFIVRYTVSGGKFIQIQNWTKHQNPHHTEKASEIPEQDGALTVKDTLEPVKTQEQDGGYLADSLIPDSGFLIPDPLTSEAKASGAVSASKPKVTDPAEIIFGYGVPLLTAAGSTEKLARSFLGGLRKEHGDEALVNTLRDCIRAKPLQPTEWLAKALPPKGRPPNPETEAARRAATDAEAKRLLGFNSQEIVDA